MKHTIVFFRLQALYFMIIFYILPLVSVYAQSPTSNLLISPDQQTILADSVFETVIFLDTKNNIANTIELNIKFPADKLAVIKPSGDKSLISIWLEPPTYSNIDGIVRLVGVIPNGINIKNGLVATITFKAKATGKAIVSILPNSKILANDGRGTEMIINSNRSIYTIEATPPEGVPVFSETHPFPDKWYNNKNIILSWERTKSITNFSFELDNKPFTMPDDITDTNDAVKSYENLSDGIWYFHIKAQQAGLWGRATHFTIHIDSTPPASFSPQIQFLSAEALARALIFFSTSDALSGIDHYEIGIIDKTKNPNLSPAFVFAQSPYQLAKEVSSGALTIIVRAFDKAGNIKDEAADINLPFLSIFPFIQNNLTFLLIVIIILLLLGAITHYFIGHHVADKLRRIYEILKGPKTNDDNHIM